MRRGAFESVQAGPVETFSGRLGSGVEPIGGPTKPCTLAAAATTLVFLLACKGKPLAEAQDVSGNYDLIYADNLRIYINDQLVAEVEAGENPTVEWNGQTFDIEAVCGEEGTTCPSEAYWSSMAVQQPWGPEYRLLNFINLDTENGTGGRRMGGGLEDDRSFAMLAGLDADGNDACVAVGIGAVGGTFEANGNIRDGVIGLAWGAGCVFGDTTIDGNLRLETDYEAVRTGPLDLSTITPEEPIDEDGEPVDPDVPE